MTIKEQIQIHSEEIEFLAPEHDSKLIGYAERKCDSDTPLYHSINFHPCANIDEAISKMNALNQLYRTADGFDKCILGILKKDEDTFVLLYDKWKIIMQLKEEYLKDTSGLFDGDEDCETSAIEYFDYNIIDAYMEGVPAFATILTEDSE